MDEVQEKDFCHSVRVRVFTFGFFDVYPTIEEATLRLIARVICIDEELGPGQWVFKLFG